MKKNKNMHRVLSSAMLLTMLGTNVAPTVVSASSLHSYLATKVEEVNEEINEISSESIENSIDDDVKYNLDELKSIWEIIYTYYQEHSIKETYEFVIDEYGDTTLQSIYDSLDYYKEIIGVDIIEDISTVIEENFKIENTETATIADVKLKEELVSEEGEESDTTEGEVETATAKVQSSTIDIAPKYATIGELGLSTESTTSQYNNFQVLPLEQRINVTGLEATEEEGTYQVTVPGTYTFDYNVTLTKTYYLKGVVLQFADAENAFIDSQTITDDDYNYILTNNYDASGYGSASAGTYTGTVTKEVTQEMIDAGYYVRLVNADSSSNDYGIYNNEETYISVTTDIYNSTGESVIIDSTIDDATDLTYYYEVSDGEKSYALSSDTGIEIPSEFINSEEDVELAITIDSIASGIFNEDRDYVYNVTLHSDGTYDLDREIILSRISSVEGLQQITLNGEAGGSVKTTGQNTVGIQENKDIATGDFIKVDGNKIYFTEAGVYNIDYNINLLARSYLSGLYLVFADDETSLQYSDLYFNSYNLGTAVAEYNDTFEVTITQDMVDKNAYFLLRSQGTSTSTSRYSTLDVDTTYINIEKSEGYDIEVPINGNGYDFTFMLSEDEFDNTSGMLNGFYGSYKILTQDDLNLTLDNGTYYYQLLSQDASTVKDATIYSFEVVDGELVYDNAPSIEATNNVITAQLDSKANNVIRNQSTDSTLNIDVDSSEEGFVSGEDGYIYFNEAGLYTINYNMDVFSEDSLDYIWFILGDDNNSASSDGNSGRNIFQSLDVGVTTGEFTVYITDEMIANNVHLRAYSNAGSGDWGKYNSASTYIQFTKQDSINTIANPVSVEDDLEVKFNITSEETDGYRGRGLEIMSNISSNTENLYLEDGVYYIQATWLDSALAQDDSSYELVIEDGVVVSEPITYTKNEDNSLTARVTSNDLYGTDTIHQATNSYLDIAIETSSDNAMVSGDSGKFYFNEAGYYNIDFNIDVVDEDSLDNFWIQLGSDEVSTTTNGSSMYNKYFTANVATYSDSMSLYVSQEMIDNNTFVAFYSVAGSGDWGRYDATNTYVNFAKVEQSVSIPVINNSAANVPFAIYNENETIFTNQNIDNTVTEGVIGADDTEINIELDEGEYYITQKGVNAGVSANSTKYYFTVDSEGNITMNDETPTYEAVDDNIFVAAFDGSDQYASNTYEFNMNEVNDNSNIASIDASSGAIVFDKAGVYEFTIYSEMLSSTSVTLQARAYNIPNDANVIMDNNLGSMGSLSSATFTVNVSEGDLGVNGYNFYYNSSTAAAFFTNSTYIEVAEKTEDTSNLTINIQDEDGNPIQDMQLDVLQLRSRTTETEGRASIVTTPITDENGQVTLDVVNDDYIISDLYNEGTYLPFNQEISVTEDMEVTITTSLTAENQAILSATPDGRYLNYVTSGSSPFTSQVSRDWLTVQSDYSIRLNEPGYYKVELQKLDSRSDSNAYLKFSNAASNQDNLLWTSGVIEQIESGEIYIYVTQDMIDNNYTLKLQNTKTYNHSPNTFMIIDKLDADEEFNYSGYDNYFKLGSAFTAANNAIDNNYIAFESLSNNDDITSDNISLTVNTTGYYALDFEVIFGNFVNLYGTDTTRTIAANSYSVNINDEIIASNKAFTMTESNPLQEVFAYDNIVYLEAGDVITLSNTAITEVRIDSGHIALNLLSEDEMNNVNVSTYSQDADGVKTALPEGIEFEFDMQVKNTFLSRSASTVKQTISATTDENGTISANLADGIYDIELADWTTGYTNNLESLGTVTVEDGVITNVDDIILDEAGDNVFMAVAEGEKDEDSVYTTGPFLTTQVINDIDEVYIPVDYEEYYSFNEPGIYTVTLDFDFTLGTTGDIQSSYNPYNTDTWNNRGNARYIAADWASDNTLTYDIMVTQDNIDSGWNVYNFLPSNMISLNYNTSVFTIEYVSSLTDYYDELPMEANTIYSAAVAVGSSPYIWDTDSDYVDMSTVYNNEMYATPNSNENTTSITINADGNYNIDLFLDLVVRDTTGSETYTYKTSTITIYKNGSSIYSFASDDTLTTGEHLELAFNESLELAAGDKITIKSTGGNQVFAAMGSYINIQTLDELPSGNIEFTSTNDTPMGSITVKNVMTSDEYTFDLDENPVVELPAGEYTITHAPVKYYSQDTLDNVTVVVDETQSVEIDTDIIQSSINVVANNEDDNEVSMTFDIYKDVNLDGTIDEDDILYTSDTTSSLFRSGKTLDIPAAQYIVKANDVPEGYVVNNYTDELVIDITSASVQTYEFRVYSEDTDYYNLGGKHGPLRGGKVTIEEMDAETGNTELQNGTDITFNEAGVYEITFKTNLIAQQGYSLQEWGRLTLNSDSEEGSYWGNYLSSLTGSINADSITINITDEMIEQGITLSLRELWTYTFNYYVTYSDAKSYIIVEKVGEVEDVMPAEAEDYDFVRYSYGEGETANVYNSATPFATNDYLDTLFNVESYSDSSVQVLNSGTYEFIYDLNASSKFNKSANYQLKIYDVDQVLVDTIDLGAINYTDGNTGSFSLSLSEGEYVKLSTTEHAFNTISPDSFYALNVVDLEGKELSINPTSSYDGSVLTDSSFEIYDENDVLVTTLNSANNFTTNRVADGTYTVKQISTNEGYILADSFEVTIDGEVSVDVENDIIKSIYKANVQTIGTDADVSSMRYDIYNSDSEVVDSLVMSEDNQYLELETLDYLVYGDYTLEETSSPEGYVASSNSAFTREFSISKDQEVFTDLDVIKYSEDLAVVEATPGKYGTNAIDYKVLQSQDWSGENANGITIDEGGVYRIYINTSLTSQSSASNMVYYFGNITDEISYANISEADLKDWSTVVTVPEGESYLSSARSAQYISGSGVEVNSNSYMAIEKLNEEEYNNVEINNANTVFAGENYDDVYYSHVNIDEELPLIDSNKEKATSYTIEEDGYYNIDFNITGRSRTSDIYQGMHASMSAKTNTWLQIETADGDVDTYSAKSQKTYASPNYTNSDSVGVYLYAGDTVSLHVENEVNSLIVRDASLTINLRTGEGLKPEVEAADPEVSGSDYAYLYELETLDDDMLIELFNIESNAIEPFRTLSITHTINPNVAGKYNIDFIVTDNTTSKTATHSAELEILDREPTITGLDSATIYLGEEVDSYVDLFEVVATEITYGDLTDVISVDDSQVKYYMTGEYPITFTARDSEGNTVTHDAVLNIARDIIDVDTLTPEVNKANPSLEVEEYFATNEGQEMTDDELIAAFNPSGNFGEDGNRELTVDSSLVNYEVPGKYPVTFTNTDLDTDLSISETVVIEILDLKPVITSSLEETVYVINENTKTSNDELDYKSLFNVVASEKETNDLYDMISVDSSKVDLTTSGAYNVTFSVSDEEGNIVKTNAYLVVAEDYVANPEGVAFDDEALYAEYVGNDVLNARESVELISEQIDFDTPAVYPVTYSYFDTNGVLVEFDAQYEVEDVLPTITAEDATITLGEEVTDYKEIFNVNATELTDNDLYDEVTVDSSNVTYSATGEYEVTFAVTDEEGNEVSTTANLTIARAIIDVDTLTPGVEVAKPTLNLGNDYYSIDEVETNTEITEEELIELFEVTTNVDGITGRELTVDYNIDLTAPNKYEVIFTNTDTRTGDAVSETAIYEVIDVLPVIEAEDVVIELGTAIDWKAILVGQASEFNENDLVDVVAVDDSGVDYNTAGNYDVILTVVDEEGNVVTTTITITIVDNGEVVEDITTEEDETTVEEVEETEETETNEETETIEVAETNEVEEEQQIKTVKDIEEIMTAAKNTEMTILETVTNEVLENTGLTILLPLATAMAAGVVIFIRKRK